MAKATRPDMGMGQQQPSAEQIQALSRFAELLKGLKPNYIPVMKSLELIGVDYKVMDIMLGDQPTECLVVPMQGLIYREWNHMTNSQQPVGEEQVDEQ